MVGIVVGVEETEDRAGDFGIVGEAVKDGWKCLSEVDLEVEDNGCIPPAVADEAMYGVSTKSRMCSNQFGVGGSTKNGECGVRYPSGNLDEVAVVVGGTDGKN